MSAHRELNCIAKSQNRDLISSKLYQATATALLNIAGACGLIINHWDIFQSSQIKRYWGCEAMFELVGNFLAEITSRVLLPFGHL